MKHRHDFQPTKTVVLPDKQSRKSFKDVLKQRTCACGVTETYDLERKIV